jgi:hypothetical protein
VEKPCTSHSNLENESAARIRTPPLRRQFQPLDALGAERAAERAAGARPRRFGLADFFVRDFLFAGIVWRRYLTSPARGPAARIKRATSAALPRFLLASSAARWFLSEPGRV